MLNSILMSLAAFIVGATFTLMTAPGYAGKGELILARQVPPRVAYRKSWPGPAIVVDTSSDIRALEVPGILDGAMRNAAHTLFGPELADADVAAVSSGMPIQNGLQRAWMREAVASGARISRNGVSRMVNPQVQVLRSPKLLDGARLRMNGLGDTMHSATDDLGNSMLSATGSLSRLVRNR